jgi:sporulation protein YlmC with PRC-barrel domain
MLKKHMAACLVATAFMAAPALAQTSSSSSSASSGAAASHSGQFINHMNPDQWRASKLVGVNIYGQNNEKIGDVNEVLIDRKGNADAIVVGVGGFLGMGEKDVALPFSAVEWKYDRNDLSTASTNRPATTGTTAANPPASGSMAANPPATGTAGAPATTGTTAANRPATADRSNMDRGYPDHGVVHFTKDELKNAPTFRYSMNDDTSRANAPARTTAPANTNPPASTTNPPATAPKQ